MLKIIFSVLAIALTLPLLIAGVLYGFDSSEPTIQANQPPSEESMNPEHSFEFWEFINDGDYQGWRINNAVSDVRDGFLTVQTPNTRVNTQISLLNHPINMYTPETDKMLFLMLSARRRSNLSSAMFSPSRQLASFTFTHEDGSSSAPYSFYLPLDGQTQYIWLPIAENTNILIDDVSITLPNALPNLEVKIDEIRAMELME